ncbi:MAG: hypothetical protein EB127_05205 [Alphaproteobacteria bacterium]|nr:hypothetical protein [Alphaproteobacteria bacterium]
MDESKLVIACHCEKHSQLHYVNPDNTIGKPVGIDVTYVDPICPNKTWDQIAPNSKKYVWGENCPVYGEFRLGAKRLRRGQDPQLLNILRESYRILENEGFVVFPLGALMYNLDAIESLKKDPEINSTYTISITNALFRLAQVSDVDKSHWGIPDENVIIFKKKPVAGGKRKIRKRTDKKRFTHKKK